MPSPNRPLPSALALLAVACLAGCTATWDRSEAAVVSSAVVESVSRPAAVPKAARPGPARARDEAFSFPVKAALASSAVASAARATPPMAVLGSATVSAEATRLANWAVAVDDADGRPFAIVDKPRAQLLVFDGQGQLLGTAPVLLGLARGDDSVPGIGERPMSQIRPDERTTPAGRFVAEPGHNANGEDILWVDYDAAVSMHRVRATNPAERRLQRLASRTAEDNRISYGCINVPATFFDRWVRSRFGNGGIVYVLPDRKPFDQVFAAAARHPMPAGTRAPARGRAVATVEPEGARTAR